MKRSLLVLSVLCLLILASQSTNAQTDTSIFPYDPVFWAPSLKLSQEQMRRIRDINSEFYTQLKSVPDRTLLPEYLQARNNQIWNTFYPRQKRRWEKIASHY